MKTLLIILTTILLISFSCSNGEKQTPNEPIVKRIGLSELKTYGKYYIQVELGSTTETFWSDIEYKIGDTLKKCNVPIIKPRDYQLDITEDMCYIYDGNRLVGKCPMKDNMIEQLITIDNQ